MSKVLVHLFPQMPFSHQRANLLYTVFQSP
jgi:hypothetical protein